MAKRTRSTFRDTRPCGGVAVMSAKKTVLANGLRVVSERVSSVKSISIGMWVDVGSRHETTELSGLSHLIEHMTFKGTRERSSKQIVQEFESRGGGINAFTSREQTCYYAKVLDAHLPVAIDVLSDILLNSVYDTGELRREQKVILEEIKDVRDTPSDWIHDHFAEVHWGKSALGLPILGVGSTVRRARRADIMNYRRRHYRPSRLVVAACGSLNHARLVDQIDRKFRDWSIGSTSPPRLKQPRVHGGLKVIKKNSSQAHLVIGFPSLPYVHKDKFALLVLQQLFGGGMSSRLFQSIRERLGLAYSVYAFQDSFRDCGVFGLYIGMDKRNASKAAHAAIVELARLKSTDVTLEEVASAKEQLKGHLVLGLENTSSRMNRLARHELYTGTYHTIPKTLRLIDHVTREDVVELCRSMIAPERMTAVAMGPLKASLLRNVDWSVLQ